MPTRAPCPRLCPGRLATQVQAIEINTECVDLIRRNAQRNGLAIEAFAANVFDLLHDLERQQARYDLIILDPPSFTKSKGKLSEAMRGYKEIHLRALKLLNSDGLLATFCCSHHVTREIFFEVINEAAIDAKKTSSARSPATSQGLDHPTSSPRCRKPSISKAGSWNSPQGGKKARAAMIES